MVYLCILKLDNFLIMNKFAFLSLFSLIPYLSVLASETSEKTPESTPDTPYSVLNENNNSILSKILQSNKNSEVFKLKLHTKISFSGSEFDNTWNKPGFNINQLRLDISGKFNNGLFFRYQQRLTNYPEPYISYIMNLLFSAVSTMSLFSLI